MHIQLNKVTWYSRLLTLFFVFGVFPVLVFYIANKYNDTVEALSYGYTSAGDMYLDGTYDRDALQGKDAIELNRNVVGVWAEKKNEKHELKIFENNVFQEVVKGSLKSSGSWILRESLPENIKEELSEGVYLQLNRSTGRGEVSTTYYRINVLDTDQLDLYVPTTHESMVFKKADTRSVDESVISE